MSRNTGQRLDRVPPGDIIYHEGPRGTFPTLADFVDLSRTSSKLRSDNVYMIYDDGEGCRRVYYITSRGNLAYTDLAGSGSLGGTAYVYFVVTESTLTTGTNKTGKFFIDFNGTITEVHASVSTAPLGAQIICDVNLNGTSIWTTGQRISIDIGATEETQTALTTTAVSEGDYLTLDVDQVGSTLAGSKLVVRVNIER